MGVTASVEGVPAGVFVVPMLYPPTGKPLHNKGLEEMGVGDVGFEPTTPSL